MQNAEVSSSSAPRLPRILMVWLSRTSGRLSSSELHSASLQFYHAVIALASLSESILHAKRDPQHQNDPQQAREHMPKTYAVQQHNKAITTLNKRMQETAESRSSAVVVLITCVLFICFANFQNDADSMLRQMSSGIHIFFDYFVERAGASQVASP